MPKSLRFLLMCLVPMAMCIPHTAEAAGLKVSNLNDSGPGSLRAQVAAAAPGDTIDFSVTGTITLSSGEIAIAKNLTFNGSPGASSVTISGNGASRVFNISGGSVLLSRLTLSGGNDGAILNSGALTLLSCTVSGSSATNGGGIYNSGSATIDSCTLSGNSGGNGGALYNAINASLTVKNSTLTGNSAGGEGGGIYNLGATTISSSTIVGNSATGSTGGGGIGQGNYAGSFTNLSNSILAGNTGYLGNSSDFRGVVSGDYNLVQNAGSQGNFGSNTILGIAPNLGALADNGGLTKTMALLSNSQAINAGNPGFDAVATPYDQRGAGYPRKVSNAVDLGAVESAFTNRVPVAVNTAFIVTPNTAFSGTLPASDRDSGDTLTYTLVTGTLPTGLTLDPATGIISGTTGGFAARTLSFKVTDSHGADSNTATATLGAMEINSLLVNTNSDAANNTDGLTSIREAVAYANTGNAGTAPVITFAADVTGTITLSTATSGVMPITRSMTITGPGAGSLKLNGINGNGARSIFNISAGTVSISGLTLSGGGGTFFGSLKSGGGLYITGGTVTVTNCTFSDNPVGPGYGGAIFMTGGGLTVADCTLLRNTAAYGGAIALNGNTVATITNCTLSGNTVSTAGGAVYTNNSTDQITIRNSTLSANISRGAGGGVLTNGGPLTIANSTLSDNQATGSGNGRGGGIYIGYSGATTITNSTITRNTSLIGGNLSSGGGIYGGPVNMSNTIVCGNFAREANLSGTTITGTNNLIDQDAKLALLADNGGPTKTHALLAGSPAINAGDPAFDATNTPYDQRGSVFARVQTGRVDIGAFESDTPQSGSSFIVNSLADTDDSIAGTLNCTLREAVKYAPADAVITFSVSGTITLTGTEMGIGKNLTIQGPSGNSGITVSGNNTSRIFKIDGGSVNLSMLTLSGGNPTVTSNSGGAISINGGTVTIASSTLSGNTAKNFGGAIYNSGVLTVVNSTFYGNSATSNDTSTSIGGAIYNSFDRSLTVVNCTFSGNSVNSTNSTGGAIRSGGTLVISNSTISGNSATTGGAIHTNGANAVVTLTNSIVAGNSATNSPDLSGIVASANYNLIQDTTGATITGANNITGQSAGLDILKSSNGGPTATRALLAGSPAIDAGDPNFDTTNTPYDQRGSGFARKSSGAIDIGAYEVQIDTTPPTISISDPSVTLANPGGTVSYTVTYADANFSSSTLSASDVTLNRTGTVDASVSVTSGSATTRTVTLSGITGYGALGISIVAGTAIDNSGNTAPAAGPSSTFAVNPTMETVQRSGTIRAAEGGGYEVGFIGNPGQEYTIQYSSDMEDGNWQPLRSQAADPSGVISIVDSPPVGTARRFYRVVLP